MFRIESLISLIGIGLPTIGFLVASLLMYKKTWDTRKATGKYRTQLYFAISFMWQGIGFLIWSLRMIMLPALPISPSFEYVLAVLMFKLAYLFSGFGMPFLLFFGISLARGSEFLDEHKWIYIVPSVILVIMAIIMFTLTIPLDVLIFVVVGVVLDFRFNLFDPMALVIVFYMFMMLVIPDFILLRYLIKTGRDSYQFKTLLILTIGMGIYSIFVLLEGGKFFAELIFFVRVGLFISTIIMSIGLYLLSKKTE